VTGAVFRHNKGRFVLPPKLNHNKLLEKKETLENLFNSLIRLHRNLCRKNEEEFVPRWTELPDYISTSENRLLLKRQIIQEEFKKLGIAKLKLEEELTQEQIYKKLLYASGNDLNEAVLKSLHVLGFNANPFRDAESEFDAVFDSEEGNFLGEVEGKDTTPINVDKIRQLVTNLNEEYFKTDAE